MAIQKRKRVLFGTKYSWSSIYEGCSSLIEELEAKEIEAYEEERYYEALLIQFSFIEFKVESSTQYFAKKIKIHPTSLSLLEKELSFNKKISYFDFIISSFVENKSKKAFQNLITELREYNYFRNDLLHNCGNPKKFKSAIHIEQSLMEAYDEGLEIMKLLTKIKIKT